MPAPHVTLALPACRAPGLAYRHTSSREFEDEAATLSLLIIIILALGAAFSYVYFVELPRYKASAQLELTPGSSRNQMI